MRLQTNTPDTVTFILLPGDVSWSQLLKHNLTFRLYVWSRPLFPIFQALSSKDGNVFISPLSVEVVLALAYMGAAGSTAEQIASALFLPPDKDDIKEGFAAVLASLKVWKGRLTTLLASLSAHIYLK